MKKSTTKAKAARSHARRRHRNGRRRSMVELPGEDGLTPRQRIFVSEYLANGWHGTNAAKKAGYACPAVTACQTLKIPKIKAIINEALAAHHLSADQVLNRLEEMATVNISDFLDANGKINRRAVKRKGYLVKSIKGATNTRGPELELHDAQAALLHLGKHAGLFKDKMEVSGPDGMAIEVQHNVIVESPIDPEEVTGPPPATTPTPP